MTLLTDFGLSDTFVGQMKGVMLSRTTGLTLVDLTHGVPPQSILTGALHLRASWSTFPPGTIHLVVVDPGVGSNRRAIALSWQGHCFVGPDNGVLDGALDGAKPEEVIEIDPRQLHAGRISRTFHGRDLFAPAAAELAVGRSLSELGSVVDPRSLVRLDVPRALRDGDTVYGTILLIDHYGNGITNIAAHLLEDAMANGIEVQCGEFRCSGLAASYAAAKSNEALALISSMDTLELAVRDGAAATRYDLQTGAEVTVKFSEHCVGSEPKPSIC